MSEATQCLTLEINFIFIFTFLCNFLKYSQLQLTEVYLTFLFVNNKALNDKSSHIRTELINNIFNQETQKL